MAYIDGAYTTSGTILKDLARALASANLRKEPIMTEKTLIRTDINNNDLYVMTTYYGHSSLAANGTTDLAPSLTFIDENGNDITDVVIKPALGGDNKRKVRFTSPSLLAGELIQVSYKTRRDSLIVFPERKLTNEGGLSFVNHLEVVEDQVSRINQEQRFIIKMTTTEDDKPMDLLDPFNEDPDHDIRRASIYFEFKKPRFVINHETMDYESIRMNEYNEPEVFTMKNNHHFFIRMIDKVDDATGVIDPNAIISNWSKMAWSTDYKEHITINPDTNVTFEGAETDQPPEEVTSRLAAVELPDFCDAERMFIKFYIHSDNDKINLIIMGNDDVALNDYLISYAYLGKIKSFVNDDTGYTYANDILGNFALTTGSSTIPLEYPRELPPNALDVDMNSALWDIKAFDETYTGINGEVGPFHAKLSITETLIEGPTGGSSTNYINFEAPQVRANYRVVFYGDDFITTPSNIFSVGLHKYLYKERNVAEIVSAHNISVTRIMDTIHRTIDPEYKMQPILKIRVPSEIQTLIKGVKIYKSIANIWEDDDPLFYVGHIITGSNTEFEKRKAFEIELPSTKVDEFYLLEQYEFQTGDIVGEMFSYTDILGHQRMEVNDDYIQNLLTVERYSESGAIKAINFSNRFGIDSTGTGTTDIIMFKTRVGSYFQKHFPAFMAPDDMMNKHGFNVSRWTDRVHVTPVYVVHPGDGYRGELMDVLFLTQTNMKNGDILIINEGKPEEEKYKFFKVTTPFSCLNASPDYNSGVAIRYHKY